MKLFRFFFDLFCLLALAFMDYIARSIANGWQSLARREAWGADVVGRKLAYSGPAPTMRHEANVHRRQAERKI